MQSELFSIGLIDKYHLFIPSKIFEPFAKLKLNRVKIKATFQKSSIEFYATLKKDKHSDTYKMMFGKRLQKELGVVLNDYFEMQIFKDHSKYGVELPEELNAVLLSDFEAYEIFESFTPGRKRSIIYVIIRIKNSQSRIDKSFLLCENLRRGVTNPIHLFKN